MRTAAPAAAGDGGAVRFCLGSRLGLAAALGAGVVLDGGDGGLGAWRLEAAGACPVAGGGVEGAAGAAVGGGRGRRRGRIRPRWGSGGGRRFR